MESTENLNVTNVFIDSKFMTRSCVTFNYIYFYKLPKSKIFGLALSDLQKCCTLLKLTCAHCGKTFEGKDEKFCSQGCRDAHIVSLDRKIREASEKNSTHTSKLSKD